MKNGKGLLSAAVGFLLFLTGCAPTVQVPVIRPAEINLVGVKRIAIGSIEGNTGYAMSDLLAQRLFESGYYEVLDRQHIDFLLREHDLSLSGFIDERTSVKIGGLLGVSALIFGTSNCQYSVVTNVGETRKSDNGAMYRDYTKTGNGSLRTSLKVVDLKTGKLLAIKQFSEKNSAATRARNQWPPDPDADMVIGGMMDRTVSRFMKMIAPYTEYITVEFEDSDLPEVQAGIMSAQSGQWESAMFQFERAVASYPGDAAALYNLGVAYTYTQRFDEALQVLNRSNALKPSSKCAYQISVCNDLTAEKRKLDMQTQGRFD